MSEKKLMFETMKKMYVEDNDGDTTLTIVNRTGEEEHTFKVFDNYEDGWNYAFDEVPDHIYRNYDFYVSNKDTEQLSDKVELEHFVHVLMATPFNSYDEFREIVYDMVNPLHGFEASGYMLLGAGKLENAVYHFICDLLESEDLLTRRKGLVRSALFLPNLESDHFSFFGIGRNQDQKLSDIDLVKREIVKNGMMYTDSLDDSKLEIGNFTFDKEALFNEQDR